MLSNCLGIINSKYVAEDFRALCKPRPAYMLPFGGRYRLVDFMLSNMVNHGISTIAVYTGNKVRSAMDHIGDGKPWELNRRLNGLHIFPQMRPDGKDRGQGDIYQYYLTDDYLEVVKEENIYLVEQNKLVKIDLSAAYDKFLKDDADIMLIYTEVENDKQHLNSDNLIFDEEGNFVNIGKNLGTADKINLFIGNLFIKKSVFRKMVRVALEVGDDSNLRNAFLRNKDEYKITTYKHEGHVEDIKDAASYYSASMNLLDEDIFHEHFFEGGSVFTRAKDEPPTLYTDDSKVDNSLIANGCIIEGEVINSIIFRGVKVEKGAVVKDSIIMQKSTIEEDATVIKSILDKNATISKDVVIVGTQSNPHIVEKNVTIRKAK